MKDQQYQVERYPTGRAKRTPELLQAVVELVPAIGTRRTSEQLAISRNLVIRIYRSETGSGPR
jgi:hypothetical protein